MANIAFFLKKYTYALALSLILVQQQGFAHFEHPKKYVVKNLVADTNSAIYQDPRLVNPWGLYIAEKGDLIVADNGTDLITSYHSNGRTNSFTANALSSPTGLVHNHFKMHFKIPGTEHPARFIISTEAGTILAFNHNVDPDNAIIVVDSSTSGSIYKGMALARNKDQCYIYATDFFNGKIDIFDENFNYVSSFTDPTIPVDFTAT